MIIITAAATTTIIIASFIIRFLVLVLYFHQHTEFAGEENPPASQHIFIVYCVPGGIWKYEDKKRWYLPLRNLTLLMKVGSHSPDYES